MEKTISDFKTIVKLSEDEAKEVCHLGQGKACCAFLVFGMGGFECIRMSYPANGYIFSRLKNGTMVAAGEGGWKNCAWEGRI